MTDTPGTNVIAVDVGGTHTDAVLLTADGRLFVNKVKSTPRDPGEALLLAVDGLLDRSGLRADDVAALVHGTTVATNAILTGRLGRVGLLTTEGFRDVLDIGTQQRRSLYDPWTPKPTPLVPRELRLDVPERVSASGAVIAELDEAALETLADRLEGRVDAIAVSFLFSFVNDDHERRVGDFLARRFPGLPVSLSSRVAPEFREYPRTSTTVLNAALLPESGSYIARLGERLRARGLAGAFQLMLSSGGVVPAAVAQQRPVSLLVSGPAAGAVGAAHVGGQAGFRDLVMLDVGGTSADVALITDGAPRRRYLGEVDGRPVNVPQIDVLPIGAGGGSIARVDEFGSLHVGPESAGADPGPAAYGLSDRPTLTDAHLVLGVLDPAKFLGGAIPLDASRAAAAIQRHVADPLGISLEQAAAAIVRIANGKMASALRMVTVARGFDIRRCALVAFGGAGPMHACDIADELGMEAVVIPRFPGLTSALGLVVSDGRYDLSLTFIARTDQVDVAALNARLAAMETEAREFLQTSGAARQGRIELNLDLRYAKQAYELTVDLGEVARVDEAVLRRAEATFHRIHEETYGHSWADRPTELVSVRLRAVVPRAVPDWSGAEEPAIGKAIASRRGWTAEGSPVEYRVLDRSHAAAGMEGPMIIEQADTTVVVGAGWHVAEVAAYGLVMRRGAQS